MHSLRPHTEMAEEFRKAFREWQQSRPEWKALVCAVRDELPPDELALLAAQAGATRSEITDLRIIRANAKNNAPKAAELPRLEKELKAIDKELELVQTKAAKSSGANLDELEDQIAQLETRRIRLVRYELTPARVAATQVEAVKKSGLL